ILPKCVGSSRNCASASARSVRWSWWRTIGTIVRAGCTAWTCLSMKSSRHWSGRDMLTLTAEFLRQTVADIFRSRRVPEEEARIVAEHLVDAEACGLPSHGLLRVPQYVQALTAEQIVPGAKPSVVSETVATAVLDGGRGFGQVMAQHAMDLAIN